MPDRTIDSIISNYQIPNGQHFNSGDINSIKTTTKSVINLYGLISDPDLENLRTSLNIESQISDLNFSRVFVSALLEHLEYLSEDVQMILLTISYFESLPTIDPRSTSNTTLQSLKNHTSFSLNSGLHTRAFLASVAIRVELAEGEPEKIKNLALKTFLDLGFGLIGRYHWINGIISSVKDKVTVKPQQNSQSQKPIASKSIFDLIWEEAETIYETDQKFTSIITFLNRSINDIVLYIVTGHDLNINIEVDTSIKENLSASLRFITNSILLNLNPLTDNHDQINSKVFSMQSSLEILHLLLLVEDTLERLEQFEQMIGMSPQVIGDDRYYFEEMIKRLVNRSNSNITINGYNLTVAEVLALKFFDITDFNVSPSDLISLVKTNWRKIAQQTHPDKNESISDDQFIKANQHYNILKRLIKHLERGDQKPAKPAEKPLLLSDEN